MCAIQSKGEPPGPAFCSSEALLFILPRAAVLGSAHVQSLHSCTWFPVSEKGQHELGVEPCESVSCLTSRPLTPPLPFHQSSLLNMRSLPSMRACLPSRPEADMPAMWGLMGVKHQNRQTALCFPEKCGSSISLFGKVLCCH